MRRSLKGHGPDGRLMLLALVHDSSERLQAADPSTEMGTAFAKTAQTDLGGDGRAISRLRVPRPSVDVGDKPRVADGIIRIALQMRHREPRLARSVILAGKSEGRP